MRVLKIKPEFAEKIFSRDNKKKYEFRKLESALPSGWYELRELKELLPEGECRDPKAHDAKIHYRDIVEEELEYGDDGYEEEREKQGYSSTWEYPITTKSRSEIAYCRKCNWQNDEYKTYGKAYLKAISINPKISYGVFDEETPTASWIDTGIEDGRRPKKFTEGQINIIDKETYDFVKENYVDKDIDFVVYYVSKTFKYPKVKYNE